MRGGHRFVKPYRAVRTDNTDACQPTAAASAIVSLLSATDKYTRHHQLSTALLLGPHEPVTGSLGSLSPIGMMSKQTACPGYTSTYPSAMPTLPSAPQPISETDGTCTLLPAFCFEKFLTLQACMEYLAILGKTAAEPRWSSETKPPTTQVARWYGHPQ